MDIRVYPEYYKGSLIGTGVEIYGRRTDDGYSRMYLARDAEILRFYDKVNTDGSNQPGHLPKEAPTWSDGDVAIGLVCCMDVQEPTLVEVVKNSLNQAESLFKVIAISAHMGPEWFIGDEVSRSLSGYHVAVSNGRGDGTPSFIATPDGIKHYVSELLVGSHLIRLSQHNRVGT